MCKISWQFLMNINLNEHHFYNKVETSLAELEVTEDGHFIVLNQVTSSFWTGNQHFTHCRKLKMTK